MTGEHSVIIIIIFIIITTTIAIAPNVLFYTDRSIIISMVDKFVKPSKRNFS